MPTHYVHVLEGCHEIQWVWPTFSVYTSSHLFCHFKQRLLFTILCFTVSITRSRVWQVLASFNPALSTSIGLTQFFFHSFDLILGNSTCIVKLEISQILTSNNLRIWKHDLEDEWRRLNRAHCTHCFLKTVLHSLWCPRLQAIVSQDRTNFDLLETTFQYKKTSEPNYFVLYSNLTEEHKFLEEDL